MMDQRKIRRSPAVSTGFASCITAFLCAILLLAALDEAPRYFCVLGKHGQALATPTAAEVIRLGEGKEKIAAFRARLSGPALKDMHSPAVPCGSATTKGGLIPNKLRFAAISAPANAGQRQFDARAPPELAGQTT